jgi:octaprenyl-diphosphate synthase
MQTFSPKLVLQQSATSARKIFSLIKSELALVEAELERQASSNIQVIKYLGDYLRASGGKRVRPSLLLMSNYAVGGDASSENVVKLAVVMEMLHTATLVHDDIIDNADTRRNRASVNARFGNQSAVLMGDWLYMSAFETSLQERSLEILDILTTLTRKMTDILQRKTAYLFSACCEIGAILGKATKEQQNALRDYGMNLGIAFQLADDVLDFTAEEEVLGKASGADLLEGKLTLPLILLREKRPEIVKDLETIIQDGNYQNYSREKLLSLLNEENLLVETRERAYTYARKASKNLEILSDSEYCKGLAEIPSVMIERAK